jgi:hypothetical protein
MMGAGELAAAAVAILAPYVSQIGGKVADKITGDIGDRLVKLWDKVHANLTGAAAKEVLADFEAQPEDDRRKGALELQLEKAIEAYPDFRKTLAALVEEIRAKGGDAIVQTANVTGDRNVTTQIAGSGNTVRR